MANTEQIKSAIRDIPDFPKPGILFKDITPVLRDPELFKGTEVVYAERCLLHKATRVAAVDARGFMFGGAVCERLDLGLVPIRKQGKLPYKTYEETYELEYGTATLAVHQDAFEDGETVVIIDDLLATGGTAAATAKLVEKAGGKVAEIAFLIELTFLDGRGKLKDYDVFSAVTF